MPVAARPAATVALVRPGADSSWETYLVRRSAQSPVLAERWVFPGGTVREDDRDPALLAWTPSFPASEAHAIFSRPPDVPAASPEESYAHFVAAARELIEEAGIV